MIDDDTKYEYDCYHVERKIWKAIFTFVSPGKRKSDAGVMVLGRSEGIWNPEESFLLFFVQLQQQQKPTQQIFQKTTDPTMMNCSRIITKRVIPTLQRKAFKVAACKDFSALVSIEDEFPGYVMWWYIIPILFHRSPLHDICTYPNYHPLLFSRKKINDNKDFRP